ncbi:hypothetical protein ABZ934_24655 [Streptomyces sp. NPDC046557]|uniref:hypothetical protein n=1 Tax=Streptomyces sp. NPDC046557 TaxID=3155372 RepID=UPI0033E1FD06
MLLVVFAVLVAVFGHASVGLAMEGALPSGIWVHGLGLGALAITAHVFAGYLTANRDALALVGRRFWGVSLPRGRNAGPVIAVWVLSLLVLVERDLGTSLVFFGVCVLMLYAVTGAPAG